jgi:archaellum component FlaC
MSLAVEPRALVELKSAKIQLEVSLIYLRRKHSDLHRQSERFGQDTTSRSTPDAVRVSAELHSIANDIASRETQIGRLDTEIARSERSSVEERIEDLVAKNETLADELANIRDDTLARLRWLVDNLRRYDDLTERKTRLVRRIAEVSGRDLSYPNYIECALARQSDCDADLRYVLDYLKRVRIVA